VELPLPLELTTSFVTYRSTYAFSDGVLEISRKLVIREGTAPAERMAELSRLRRLITRDFDQSVVFKRQGDFDVAADAAGMDLPALLKAGKAAAENEDLESAGTYFAEAVQKDHENKEALEGLGNALLQMGRPETAEGITGICSSCPPSTRTPGTRWGSVWRWPGRRRRRRRHFSSSWRSIRSTAGRRSTWHG
jgi:hypothetical protein